MIYGTFLALHNVTRWLVLALGLWACARLIGGWARRRVWSETDRRSVRWFALALSLQFVFGAVLYFFPGTFIDAIRGQVSMATIMQDRVLRFFVVEHPFQMIIAVAGAHLTSLLTRRITTDRRRFVAGSLLLLLTMLLILTAIPWPFLDHGRPLFRLP